MYEYELINNHYIIEIEGKKYLLDTGSPVSFGITEGNNQLIIDGNTYCLRNKPANLSVSETEALVGTSVDGFIGMDIVSQTGLTIYKNGLVKFGVDEVKGGVEVPMTTKWPLMVSIGCNLMNGKLIIDTGAKYGYGVDGLFHNQQAYAHVKDYNPSLGRLESDSYHLPITIGGKSKTIDVCNNRIVGATLHQMGAIMIGSVSSLYNEVCVLDTHKGKLVLK